MNKCKYGDYRSFVHCGEAYYARLLGFSPGTVDEVFFGLSCGAWRNSRRDENGLETVGRQGVSFASCL